nr:potassium channel family protein [Pseudomonas veronii]
MVTYLGLVVLYGLIYQFSKGTIEGVTIWLDGIYFSIVTATTLGFGDLKPLTAFGKVLVSSQVFFEVLLIGFFLNALSFQLSERVKAEEIKQTLEEKERLRKGLDRHLSLLVEAVLSTNPFHWDKHPEYCANLASLRNSMSKLQNDLKSKSFQLSVMNIKTLLETCDQIYETYIGLLPVAASISPLHLLKWSSILSSVRHLRDLYKSKSVGSTAEVLDGDLHADKVVQWPSTDDVRMQVQEFMAGADFFAEPIMSMDYLNSCWILHEMKII